MKKDAYALYDISEAAKSAHNPELLHGWMIKNRPDTIPENKAEQFWLESLAMFDLARFARLASFLRQTSPDSDINYSVYVFDLNENDLNLALDSQLEILQE